MGLYYKFIQRILLEILFLEVLYIMNSSDIFSSQVFWIGLFVLIFACHVYAYWSMTKNINEGFREGQHNAPPLGAKKTNITASDRASIAAAEAAGIATGGGTHPSEVFQQFRGRNPNPESLLRHNGIN